MVIQPFLTYNPETGLIVKTKSEILQTLIDIAKAAYGDSYIVDEGTEMYTFLDILASGLADMGNATLDVYSAFSFIYATGAPLDSLCSLAGVIRKENETDSQLRARYYRFLYSKSVGTVEGLEAKLLEYSVTKTDENNNTTTISPIKDVKIYENYTGDAVSGYNIATNANGLYNIPAHSILVILHLDNDYTCDNDDIDNINTIITDYKSLGCGIVTEAETDTSKTRYFVTTNTAQLTLTVNIYFYNESDKINYGSAVKQNLKSNIREYLSELQLGEDIQYSAIMSCVYKTYNALNVKDYIFAVGTGEKDKETGSDNSITYSGKYIYTKGSETTLPNNACLTSAQPNIIIPYTTYINPQETTINIELHSPKTTRITE